MDKKLYRLRDINAFKLKPFLVKREVIIPAKLSKTYFTKFISSIVAELDIRASGFNVEKSSDFLGMSARVVEDVFQDRLLLEVLGNYSDATFIVGDEAQGRTKLIFDSKNEVLIKRVIRDPEKENKVVGKLLNNGFQQNAAGRFFLENTEHKHDLIQWLIQHKPLLAEINLKVALPQLSDKKISLNEAHIRIHTNTENDWFDLKGEVEIGEFRFPFTNLIEYIRREDTFYPLPDGSFFIIPEEWMTKYREIARFGEVDGDRLRLQKSNYTLLGSLDNESGDLDKMVDQDEVEYESSNGLNAELRPYQINGIKWLIAHQQNGLGACLADDMGLGKTLQTIAVLLHYKESLEDIDVVSDSCDTNGQLALFGGGEKINPALNALIVMPASLVYNWYEEIEKFAPGLKAIKYIGSTRKNKTDELSEYDVILTTYQTALRDEEALQKIDLRYIILDESQYIKNKNSKVFKSINRLNTENRISLSGTPIENSLSDLWSQMQFINPNILGNYKFFKAHFQTPIEKKKNEEALVKLRSIVHPFILRRTKSEVLSDLPELTEQVHFSQMSTAQKKIYETEKSSARNFLLDLLDDIPQNKIHVFTSLLRLRQISNHPIICDSAYTDKSGKFDDVIEKLNTVILSGQKVLVFSAFTSHLDLFSDWLKKSDYNFSYLSGQTNQKQRANQIKDFQNNPECQVFLISIKAGGTGLNLTAADYVFILDPWWNPSVEQQAIARAHRIGRKGNVNVIRFISKDSIEEKIMKLQLRKHKLSKDILDVESGPILTEKEVNYLLE